MCGWRVLCALRVPCGDFMGDDSMWQEVYTRLERARQALEAGEDRPPDEVRRILRERAQVLARPPKRSPAPTETLELLIFALAGEQYGIETAHVIEVVPLREVTSVPGTPSFLLGVINYRGRILPVLDFRRLLELAGQGVTEGNRAVVVEVRGMAFGVLADALAGTVRVGVEEVGPPPVALAGDRQTFLRGVTGDLISVVDLVALTRDPRLLVNEEV